LKKPDIIKEKNWFFRLSAFQEKLEKLYKNIPNFVIPD
jgi:methionyl-tRNA synthetase